MRTLAIAALCILPAATRAAASVVGWWIDRQQGPLHDAGGDS